MKHYKKKNTGKIPAESGGSSVLEQYKKRKETVRIANTPYLVILESPSKCKKIEKYLGFQYKCIASNGHIRGLSRIKKKKNGEYEPVFDILSEKAAHVAYMREIIAHFLPTPENIFIATDDDREGEAIGWHICQTFGLPVEKVRRMIFHEITEKVIQEAARNTTSIRMGIVFAQQARQMLDQMVGFEISPLLTKRLSGNTALSAGRCQTPALRFVYDKVSKVTKVDPLEIEYRITGSFFSQFPLRAILLPSLTSETEVELFLEKSKTFAHEMTLEKPTIRTIQPPIPFNTSRLLQYTNNRWNMSPKSTMDYCQILYQHGYITYMRTESSKYSEIFLEQICAYLADSNKGSIREDYNNLLHEMGMNPHEAIRVTDIRVFSLDISFIENNEKRISDLYEAIWRRSIQSCMKPYEYKNVDVFFSAPFEKKYQVSLELPISEGFMCFSEDTDKQQKQQEIYTLYHFLQTAKSPVKCIEIEANFQCANKPRTKYYTESSLIQTLEEYGIGRPSTYAMLVDTIQERGYVKKQDIEGTLISGYDYHLTLSSGSISRTTQEKRFGQEKNKLVLQTLGKSVIETLLPTFDSIFSYDFTKEMERKLDRIDSIKENSIGHLFDICTEMELELKKHTVLWKTEMQEKYEIDETHELFFSKKGIFIREMGKGIENNTIQRVRNIKLDLEKLKRKEYTLEDL
jgi:DNA topoisomerase-1